jgi:hypothetical protein
MPTADISGCGQSKNEAGSHPPTIADEIRKNGTLWNIMEHLSAKNGTLWNTMEHLSAKNGTLWNTMEHSGGRLFQRS